MAHAGLFPILVDYSYPFNLWTPPSLIYEFSKDAFTYALLILGFTANRVIERRSAEARAANAADVAAGRLTLPSGGSTFVVAATDLIYAKAAENYVEVHTGAKPILARLSLAKLESRLRDFGRAHARVHRSYIVNLHHVAAVTPTGEGDVEIALIDGTVVPGSRSYRDRLAGLTARPS